MADRIVNVPINFTLNTQQVERYEQLAKRTDQTTEKLRQSTQNFAQAASKGYQSTSKYIEGMEVELARLRQQIKLTSTQDTQRLSQLSAQYKALKGQVDQYNKALFQTNAATKQVAQSTGQLAGQFNDVYTAVKLFITAGVVRELVNINLEFAKIAGNAEGVERAFKRAFPGSEVILNDLRESTHNTVTEFELMQRTLQATNLGVNVNELGVLFEFAAARAQQTGESVDYLVDSIVRGIGRKSLLILDNLGLSATRLKEQFGGASLASQSVAEVTRGVAEIAKVELEKMGGYAETSATKVDQLTASWKGLREEMAKALTGEGGSIDVLKSYVDSFKAMAEARNRNMQVSELFAEQQRQEIAIISANEFIQRRFTKSREENIKILEEEIQAITKQIGGWTSLRDIQIKAIAKLEKELTGISGKPAEANRIVAIQEELKFRRNLIEANKEDALIDQEILKLLQARLLILRQIKTETVEQLGLIEATEEQINSLSEDLKKAKTVDEIARINTQLAEMEARLKRLKEINTGLDSKLFSSLNPKESKDKKRISAIVDRNQLVDVQAQIDEATKELFVVLPVQIKPMPYKDSDFTKAWDEVREELIDRSFAGTEALINSVAQREIDSYTIRIEALRNFYDEQMILAGDNERAKREMRLKEEKEIQKLERERADREKQAALAGITVNFALGVAKIWAGEGTWADKLVRSIILGAEAATQFAIASNARYYAKGEVDIKGGTPGKDSIPAMIMPGESVITTENTKNSKGILKAIQAKKLNDRVMRDLVSGRSGGSTTIFDDSKIVKKLDEIKNATPDIERRGNMIYEARKRSDNYRLWIRKQSMGS